MTAAIEALCHLNLPRRLATAATGLLHAPVPFKVLTLRYFLIGIHHAHYLMCFWHRHDAKIAWRPCDQLLFPLWKQVKWFTKGKSFHQSICLPKYATRTCDPSRWAKSTASHILVTVEDRRLLQWCHTDRTTTQGIGKVEEEAKCVVTNINVDRLLPLLCCRCDSMIFFLLSSRSDKNG
jgi:hypothetical protein